MNKKTKLEFAEILARKKHQGQFRRDGTTPFLEHLENVVEALKQIGITNEDILCAGWLHDSIEDTDITYEELRKAFGKTVVLLVMSLTKDRTLPKKQSDEQYIEILKNAPLSAKIIKLCDIYSNLHDIYKSGLSDTIKIKKVKQINNYLNVINKEIFENMSSYSNVESIISKINNILSIYGLQPIKANIG